MFKNGIHVCQLQDIYRPPLARLIKYHAYPCSSLNFFAMATLYYLTSAFASSLIFIKNIHEIHTLMTYFIITHLLVHFF